MLSKFDGIQLLVYPFKSCEFQQRLALGVSDFP